MKIVDKRRTIGGSQEWQQLVPDPAIRDENRIRLPGLDEIRNELRIILHGQKSVEHEDIRRQPLELFTPAVRAGARSNDRNFVAVIPLKTRDQIQIEFVGASDLKMGSQH